MSRQLAAIKTFGDVSAEDDDAILSYFIKTDAVDRVESGDSYVVIGRKGSGKTALAKYFSQSKEHYVTVSPSLRDYPWNLHAKRKNLGASSIESYVSSWRYLIAVKANSAILEQVGMTAMTDAQLAARDFLTENYGGISPSLGDILAPKKIKITRKTLAPSIMGSSLGSIDFEDANGALAPEIDALSDILIKNAIEIAKITGISSIFLHFDELDQGLSTLENQQKDMITGIILASRSIRTKHGDCVRPVCYVRTDIWNELQFSDKNKISQASSVNLEWDANTLLAMVNERIKKKLGNQASWEDLIDDSLMRGSQSKWSHIVSRTFLRPRDIIQFLNFALDKALKELPDSDIFDNDDIQSAREPYSRYLKQELDDEIGPHWERWSEALQACSELATITFSRDDFHRAYKKRRSNKNLYDADEALEMLYDFSVIGYRRGIGSGGSGWVFQYTDPDAGWDNGASKLKVHLGLKEFAKLREERSN